MTAVQKLNKRLHDLPEQEREALAAALLEELEALERDWQIDVQAEQMPTRTRPRYDPFPVKKRVAGLGKGTIEMAPDFDDPLPDSFWLGQE